MIYRSLHALNTADFSDFFTLCNLNTHGHSIKL